MQRYDVMAFRAEKTSEGFIRDAPIVGRSGLLKYRNADGSERVEYRPPEDALAADSLASLEGKPITLGHKAMVTAGNATEVAPIGTVLSSGWTRSRRSVTAWRKRRKRRKRNGNPILIAP